MLTRLATTANSAAVQWPQDGDLALLKVEATKAEIPALTFQPRAFSLYTGKPHREELGGHGKIPPKDSA